MTTIRVKFCPPTATEREGMISYQITHGRSVRLLESGYTISPDEWDPARGTVRFNNLTTRNEVDRLKRRGIRIGLERLKRIVRRLEDTDMPYTIQDILYEYSSFMEMNSLFTLMKGMIGRLRAKGSERTAETYIATIRSFRKFLTQRDPLGNGGPSDDILLDHITDEVMEEYESWCGKMGLVPNTISFYMRILRAVYNKAVDERVIEDARPFRRVYTGNERTRKRAISISALRRIKALDIPPGSPVGFARDMFLMSFYLRGMSFVDMSFLRKCDLREGYLTYRRRKTGQCLSIRWTKEMQKLLDRYPENPTQYLLPIIDASGADDRHCYRNACSKINRNLKRVGELARVKVSLSMYVARHSWATAARHKGIPISVISEGMGHSSELTTQIYLASMDGELVDNANALLIRSI